MANDGESVGAPAAIAQRWCETHGPEWRVTKQLGEGGTAPVFEVITPDGPRALKIYSEKYSTGRIGEIEQRRLDQQLALKGHDCPYLVQIYDGGKFEDRLFLLMSRAPGTELEKCLKDVPRDKIRTILDQVARAAIFLREENLCHRDIKAANVFVSDDFDHCTLLDISVVRDVVDPIGVGTDHENQLPVVATARYSPPEYLFRLLDPGAELWHALNVYQLGALLHDLIMKQPLFHAEYLQATENRYRFAWIVATVLPQVKADDVDQGLVLTAQRSLDKDWRRRSALKLEDFLADNDVQRRQALLVLGLRMEPEAEPPALDMTTLTQRLDAVARNLDDAMAGYLMDKGVTAKHTVQPGRDDFSRILTLRWDFKREPEPSSVALQITIRLVCQSSANSFQLSIALKISTNGVDTRVTTELPDVSDGPAITTVLTRQAEAAFEGLAIEATSATQNQIGKE